MLISIVVCFLVSDSTFVRSFDAGNFVYFFFSERATEYENCIDARLSRVARVCKVPYHP